MLAIAQRTDKDTALIYMLDHNRKMLDHSRTNVRSKAAKMFAFSKENSGNIPLAYMTFKQSFFLLIET